MSELPSLLEFPCDFPIKVMGKRDDSFPLTIGELVQQHAADFDPASVKVRLSSHGLYMALTCTVRATSREQLDNLYRALTSHPLVKVAL